MDIEYNTRGFLTVFFRQFFVFILVFGLITVASVFYLMNSENVYEARGSLLLRLGDDARPDPTFSRDQNRSSDISSSHRKDTIQSYIKILQSRDLLRSVINDMGVERLYPEVAQNTENLLSPTEIAISILLGGAMNLKSDDSSVISIGIENKDPQIAAEFTKLLMKSFILRQVEIYDTPQITFMKQQIVEAKNKLEASQEEFHLFKNIAEISSIDEEMFQLVREKTDLSVVAFSALTEAQAELDKLEVEKAQMLRTYKQNSPMVQRLEESMNLIKAQIKIHQGSLDARGETSNTLSAKIADIDKRISYLESQRARFDQFQRQTKLDEENYFYYVQRGEEARINDILNMQNITHISVIDSPVVPLSPIRPRKDLFFVLSLLAAFMAGVGIVLVRELQDERFSRPEQVTATLSIPLLATFDKRERRL